MEVDGKPSHVGRGRVSPRRLPEPARILEPARTRYAGSNDHHFCEKLCAVESLSIGCETSAAYCVRPGSPPYSRAE
jgi:hypothetical protein